MRRDKISIRYRQVSILRRWSITTLSRHQMLRDELCFIFCYRLNTASQNESHCRLLWEPFAADERARVRAREWESADMTHNSTERTRTSISLICFVCAHSRDSSKCLPAVEYYALTRSLWRTVLLSLCYGMNICIHMCVCMYWMYVTYVVHICTYVRTLLPSRSHILKFWRNLKAFKASVKLSEMHIIKIY